MKPRPSSSPSSCKSPLKASREARVSSRPVKLDRGSVATIRDALGALESKGISPTVVELVEVNAGGRMTEIGSLCIDCEAPHALRRNYPDVSDVIAKASKARRALVEWFDWPWRPGVVAGGNGLTLTNAGHARIRLCVEDIAYWDRSKYLDVDARVPTVYVFRESELLKAARSVAKELTIGPVCRIARVWGRSLGEFTLLVFILWCIFGTLVLGIVAAWSFGKSLGP